MPNFWKGKTFQLNFTKNFKMKTSFSVYKLHFFHNINTYKVNTRHDVIGDNNNNAVKILPHILSSVSSFCLVLR
jgi:hypothetical protein